MHLRTNATQTSEIPVGQTYKLRHLSTHYTVHKPETTPQNFNSIQLDNCHYHVKYCSV